MCKINIEINRKGINFTFINFIFVSVFLFASSGLSFAQSTCTVTINTVVTPQDCAKNGSVTISLSGTDVSAGYVEGVEYKVTNNTSGETSGWVQNNAIGQLLAGSYKVEVRYLCTKNGISNSDPIFKNVTITGGTYVTPSFTITGETSNTFSCNYSGVIAYTMSAGKAPYTLTLKSYPATYTGAKVFNGIVANTATYIRGLPAGTYSLSMSDACGTILDRDVVIGTVSQNYPAKPFFGFFYPTGTNCDIRLQNNSAAGTIEGELINQWKNWELFYEYAWVLPTDDLGKIVWQSFTKGATSVSYSTPSTVKDMRLDINLVPQLYVRVKGGTCPAQIYKSTFGNTTSNLTRSTTSCTTTNLNVSQWGGNQSANSIFCFPYTWRIDTITGANVVPTSAPTSSLSFTHTGLPHGTYRVVFTDNEGYSWSTTTASSASGVVGVARSSVDNPCSGQATYEIYDASKSLAGYKFKFMPGLSDAGHTPPLVTEFTLPNNYTGYYVYPLAPDYTKRTMLDLAPGKYVFQVTNACGFSANKEVIIPHPVVSQPLNYRVDTTCTTFNVTPLNLANMYSQKNYNNTVSYLPAYLRVSKVPAGVDINKIQFLDKAGKPTGFTYCRPTFPGDYIVLPTVGVYELTVNTNSLGYSANSCPMVYTINVSFPTLELDPDTKASYRCEGSSLGVGYISVKGRNGSGNYEYTLYSKTDPAAPLKMTNPAYKNPNGTGVFKDWETTTSDDYLVKITDLTCPGSITQEVNVYNLGNATLLSVDGGARKCEGDNVQLRSFSLGQTEYEWTGPDPSWTSTLRSPVILNAGPIASGEYTVKIRVPGCGPEATITRSIMVSVSPKKMYWKDIASSNNWNDDENWLGEDGNPVKAVPAPCTTVHIPGNAKYLPILDNMHSPRTVYGFPSCDTIVYHYGAETVYPQYLQYRRAKVQYNFGYYNKMTDPTPDGNADDDMGYWFELPTNPPLKRAQWYSLAAPLKQMTGGDFGIGPKPMIWQRLYNPATNVAGVPASLGFTKEFSKQNIDLKTTSNALGIWVSDYQPAYTGMGDHSDLQGLQGVLEMPYHTNPAILKYRPLQTYVPIDANKGTSYFQYYTYFGDGTILPSDKKDDFARDTTAFRFIYENALGKIDQATINGTLMDNYRMDLPANSQGQKIFIGNPFMSSINFDKLYQANSGVLDNSYIVNDANTNYFLTYQIGGPTNTLERYIAPLQGFIVQVKASPTKTYLDFPMTEGASSVMEPYVNIKPRSVKATGKGAVADQGYIALYGITPPVIAGKDSVKIVATLMYNYNIGNVTKSVFPEDVDTKAEVFFIDDKGYLNTNQEEYAKRSVIPLGLQSTYTGEILFKLEQEGDAPIDQVFLVDKYLGKTVELNDVTYYPFTHRAARVESGVQGLDTDRFELNVFYRTITGIPETSGENFIIRSKNNELIVTADSPIENIQVTDLQGRSVKEFKNINSNSYNGNLRLSAGIYIVKVDLKNGQAKTKKIVVN